jgi:Ca2+-binding RTX toxin-like protein
MVVLGDDILLGGEGDDTYIVDSSSDVISELANQGLDTVQSATIDLDLGNYARCRTRSTAW